MNIGYDLAVSHRQAGVKQRQIARQVEDETNSFAGSGQVKRDRKAGGYERTCLTAGLTFPPGSPS